MEQAPDQRSPFAGENRVSWLLRKFWRANFRPHWRNVRAPVVIVLGFSVIVLGTWGFTDEGYDFWEALFKSFQLYGFAAGDLETGDPVALNVAKVLGPLLVGVAAVRGLLVLSREQLRLVGFRLFRKGHIVIVGLGDVGFTLAERLNDLGARVIAIDVDSANPAIEGCKERGISTLVGDATDSKLLRAACAHRAKHLIIAPGSDSVTIDVLAAAAAITTGRPANPLRLIAHIEDRSLWQALQAHTLRRGQAPSLNVELFNLYEAAGRRVLGAHPPFTPADAGERSGPEVLVVADQAIAEVLVVNVARLWRNSRAHSRAKIEVTLAGPGTEAEVDRIRERYPAIDGIAHLEAWEIDLSSPNLRQAKRGREAGRVYVALGDEARAVATSLTIAAVRSQGAPVVLIVNDERLGARDIAGGQVEVSPIALFGILDLVLDEHFLVGGLQETLAEAIHNSYYEKELAKGDGTTSKAVPWEQLDEDGRNANRDAAALLPRNLERIGCAVVPAALADVERSQEVFDAQLTPATLEELSEAEHDRWMEERTRSGWTFAPERNDELKQHDLLIPYAELSEPEKDKDRNNIRELPDQLAMAGFSIEAMTRAPTVPNTAPAPARSDPA
jgi:TrkA-N domain/RyR domain